MRPCCWTGGARGGLNLYHAEVWLEAGGPGTHELLIEAVPRGLFGSPKYDPRLE